MRTIAFTIGTLLLASSVNAQVVTYDSNPRIIHVPDARARHFQPAAHAMTDEEIIERIERRKAQPRRSLAKSLPEAPRPRAEFPPPSSEARRALLSAPPPLVGPGSLTPIYPTPRYSIGDPPAAVTANNDE